MQVIAVDKSWRFSADPCPMHISCGAEIVEPDTANLMQMLSGSRLKPKVEALPHRPANDNSGEFNGAIRVCLEGGLACPTLFMRRASRNCLNPINRLL